MFSSYELSIMTLQTCELCDALNPCVVQTRPSGAERAALQAELRALGPGLGAAVAPFSPQCVS